MNEIAIRMLLGQIETEWRSLRPWEWDRRQEPPPWGVWIRLLAPLEDDVSEIDYPDERLRSELLAVKFLDERGLTDKSVWAYHRFVTVHYRRPWCRRFYERSAPGGKIYHSIAAATIAPYRNGAEWYVDFQWGGTYGRGYRLTLDENGDERESNLLWVS